MEDIKHYKCRNVQEQVAYNSKRIDDLKEDVEYLKEHSSPLEFNVEIPDGVESIELKTLRSKNKYYIIGEPPAKIDINLFQVSAYTDGPYDYGDATIEITELNDSLRIDLISILERCLSSNDEHIDIKANWGWNEETGEPTYIYNRDLEDSSTYDEFSNYWEGDLFIAEGYASANSIGEGAYALHLELYQVNEGEEGGDSILVECLFNIYDADSDEPFINLEFYTLGW